MGRQKKQDIISVKEFAAILHISPASVTRHIKAGNITERSIAYSGGGKPKILVDYALEDMLRKPAHSAIRHTRGGTTFGGDLTKPEKRTAQKVPTNKEAEKIADTLRPEMDAQGNVTVNGESELTVDGITLDFTRDPTNLAEAKVRLAIAQAVKLELENKQKRGTLVDKRAQDIQFAAFAVNFKKDISAVADRVAALVAAESSPTVCRNIVYKENEDVLIKHSKKWPK